MRDPNDSTVSPLAPPARMTFNRRTRRRMADVLASKKTPSSETSRERHHRLTGTLPKAADARKKV